MTGDDLKLGHPKQRKNFDLSKEPRELRRDGEPSPRFETINSDRKDPETLMRQMGFEPTKNMNPLQFLLAVMNDDLAVLFKSEKRRECMEAKGGLSMQYRLEAAKTAAKFIHMEMPKLQITSQQEKGFGEELSNAIAAGSSRVIHRETIIREIERTSPDIPLAPASYPPDFIDTDIIEPGDVTEGDLDYDPDRDDADDTE